MTFFVQKIGAECSDNLPPISTIALPAVGTLPSSDKNPTHHNCPGRCAGNPSLSTGSNDRVPGASPNLSHPTL